MKLYDIIVLSYFRKLVMQGGDAMENTEKIIYENVISNLSDGVLVIGFDGKIKICNEAACSALQIERESMIGSSLVSLMGEVEENDAFFEILLDAVYTRKTISKIVPFLTKDSLRHLLVTTSFLSKDDEKIALIAVISDHTEMADLFIRNKRLASQVINLMNSFVEVMVTAIEEKTPYNANHTKKMAGYAQKYLDWLKQNPIDDAPVSENPAPFIMSVWLHDIGKLIVPQEVMDKPTRLGGMLKDIQHRIETARLMQKIEQLSGAASEETTAEKLRELDAAEELILSANTAGFLDENRIQQLKAAAEIECLAADGSRLPLLNAAELEAVTVVRGTLTADERKTIESHVSLTAKLLSKMEFRGEYANVPLWAGGHHELIDGSGYPEHLRGKEIPWQTRLLTIIDIYDALTAEDRPYKPPMPPEKAFAILRDMAANGKLDSQILESFFRSEAWKKEISA